MSDSTTQKCPARGCERRVLRSMLSCRQHWYKVSRPTRDEVYAAYRSGDATRHSAAMRKAIAEMNGARPAGEQHRFHDGLPCFPGCPAWDSKASVLGHE